MNICNQFPYFIFYISYLLNLFKLLKLYNNSPRHVNTIEIRNMSKIEKYLLPQSSSHMYEKYKIHIYI